MKRINLLILKAVTSCNLACTYCSAHCQEKKAEQLNSRDVIQVWNELLSCGMVEKSVQVLWHGGEPTLYDPDDAELIMRHIGATAALHGIAVRFTMQSNGVQISERWLKLILQYGIKVGISLDGPEDIQNASRCMKDGKGSYKNVSQTLAQLREQSIFPRLLSVIDERQAKKTGEFFDWLCETGLPIKLNPRFSCDEKDWINIETYFKFLKEIFILSVKSGQNCTIAPLEKMLRAILYGTVPSECSYSGKCGLHILCISPGGWLSTCGRLADNSNLVMKYSPGTLPETAEILDSQIAAARKKSVEINGCDHCSIQSVCNGACTVFSLGAGMKRYCESFRNFYAFLAHDGLLLLREQLLQQKMAAKSRIDEANAFVKKLSEK